MIAFLTRKTGALAVLIPMCWGVSVSPLLAVSYEWSVRRQVLKAHSNYLYSQGLYELESAYALVSESFTGSGPIKAFNRKEQNKELKRSAFRPESGFFQRVRFEREGDKIFLVEQLKNKGKALGQSFPIGWLYRAEILLKSGSFADLEQGGSAEFVFTQKGIKQASVALLSLLQRATVQVQRIASYRFSFLQLGFGKTKIKRFVLPESIVGTLENGRLRVTQVGGVELELSSTIEVGGGG